MSIVSFRRWSSAHSTRKKERVGAYDAPEAASNECRKGASSTVAADRNE
jgi:hypothetical protein